MALNDYKITQQEIENNNVKAAKDDYIGTPAKEVKHIFDKLPELTAGKLNSVIDNLVDEGGAAEVGKMGGGSVQEHIDDVSNPHHVTKADIGLSNVNNTSDYDKPLSYLQERALEDFRSNILTKDNTVPYEPSEDYHPVTLKALNEVAVKGGAVASVFGSAGIIVELDCGDFSQAAISEHNRSRRAHENAYIDGALSVPLSSDADLEQHKVNQTAHQNMIIDGKELK